MAHALSFRSAKTLVLFFILTVYSACKPTQDLVTATPDVPAEATIVDQVVQEPQTPEFKKQEIYRAEPTKFHDLVHTKLEVRFDWGRQYLLGKATLELIPYFYPQASLTLDAKGFDINTVRLVEGANKKDLTYQYDGMKLLVTLDRTYTKDQSFFIEIDYVAKPNELESGGSTAITSDKGLYFINPTGNDGDKPQQIWTQGETEASSCWFPTIDSPNQKTTQEIYITVEDRFTTLSNGQLVFSQGNGDGTRTDYWKMTEPHAPYLFMMAIGEYAVIKDQWEGKDVTYYVEPEYEKYARDIFGRTPQMMTYFSQLLNYPYPWSKYAQVVVRDYVSGAMENTTASVFMEDLQVDDRYLIDDNWDGIIAHELLHQWFGDLVTCESWSNLTLNEAFATYAEYLWSEHHLGRDDADYLGYEEKLSYLSEAKEKKVDLIRFYYDDKEEMFDNHSYAKGGRILHMLRKYVGDEAFFTSLNDYLTTYAYQPVEVHHLRLSFEKVTGQDLNWFFNQWFLDSGHPLLKVTKEYHNDSLRITVAQHQDLSSAPIYRLPISMEIWHGNQKQSTTIVLDQQLQHFSFPMAQAPDLVIFDSESQLLAEVDYPRGKAELMNQYQKGEHAMVRLDALESLLADSVADEAMVRTMITALQDKFWAIRQLAVNIFEGYNGEYFDQVAALISSIAVNDPKSLVRADAITSLSSFHTSEEYLKIYEAALADLSFSVAGAGLTAYLQTEASNKDELLQRYEKESNIQLVLPLADHYALNGIPGKYQWFQTQLSNGRGELLYYLVNYFGQYLVNANDQEQKEGTQYLEDLGLNHQTYYVRFSAYQALGLLEELEGVIEMKRRIKSQEKDPRLVEAYQQMP